MKRITVLLTGWVILGALVSYTTYGLMGPNVVQDSQSKVVEIHVSADGKNGWMGSGAYVSSDGLVLTCAHLFEHKSRFIFITSNSGQRTLGHLVRLDTAHDLALVKTYVVTNVPYFKLGKAPKRGETVYSFGSPLGHQRTVTKGIVENLGVTKAMWTMHGASINPGNSGGPLVNSQGLLVGVNVTTFLAPGFMGLPSPAQSMNNAVSVAYIKALLED